MTGPLNWYKDNAQRAIDESKPYPAPSPLAVILSLRPLHSRLTNTLTSALGTFPGLPPTLPVLFIFGKYDPTCLEFSLKLMKFLASVGIINARFEEVEAWHWVMHERTDEVNKFTLEFLKDVLA